MIPRKKLVNLIYWAFFRQNNVWLKYLVFLLFWKVSKFDRWIHCTSPQWTIYLVFFVQKNLFCSQVCWSTSNSWRHFWSEHYCIRENKSAGWTSEIKASKQTSKQAKKRGGLSFKFRKYPPKPYFSYKEIFYVCFICVYSWPVRIFLNYEKQKKKN